MNRLLSSGNSVQSKLLRSIALSLALSISLAGIMLIYFGNKNMQKNMVQGLEVIAKIIADRSAASLVFRDIKAAQQNLSTASNKNGIEQLCLYDITGNLFSSFTIESDIKPCAPVIPTGTSDEITIKQSKITISVPVTEQADMLGRLKLISNTAELKKTQNLYAIALMTALVISLIIALSIGRTSVSRVLAPLVELYHTSKVVSQNPLSNVRARKFSQDEFGRVIDVFNNMLDAFGDENKALIMSENRFRSLAENSPVGVYLKTRENDYQYINSTWSDITGLKGKDIESFISRIDVRDKMQYLQTLEQAYSSKKPQVVEYQYICPSGVSKAMMEYISCVPHESEGSSFIGSLLDVTELKEAQVELEKLAFYDPLTQLPNRRFFRDHLEFSIARANKDKNKIAVCMVDLDDFKKVNDSLGHDVGDALLVKIATQLRRSLSDEDVVSRMGGDEFMILIDNIDDLTCLEHASRRILEALKNSVQLSGTSVQVSGSIGAAIYPTDARTPEELVRYADIALYNAKSKGGARFSFYSRDLDRKIKEKLRLEQKLRSALDNQELEVYIQPQYVAETLSLFWGEALVRWRDKEDGDIPPHQFISLAEENGLIHQIGDFVFETVCQLLRDKSQKLDSIGMKGISVNISARQFFSDNFIDSIKAKFEQYSISPERIEFELTESTVMDDVDQAVVVMEAIRELGCRLSIDDFGTGYSSLSYLKRFPITSLKIDRSFIRDIPQDKNDVEISCAVIAMAHSLGLTVVAEGVETEVQAKLLASYGCEYLQGYFLDRPMPFKELLERVGIPAALVAPVSNKAEGA